MADWDKKAKSFNLLPTIHSPWGKGHFQIESEGWEKRFHANGQDRKAGVAVLISDKRDFKIKAIKKDITIYAAHTNLDSAMGGVNFKIAEKIGLEDVQWIVKKATYTRDGKELTSGEGLIGTLSRPTDPKDFMERVKETFGIRSLRANSYTGSMIRTVALCGGAGAHLIPTAAQQGADAFMTGEIGYHRFFGYEQKMLLLEMGHYESEQYTLELFSEIISKIAPSLPVLCAETKTNPINCL